MFKIGVSQPIKLGCLKLGWANQSNLDYLIFWLVLSLVLVRLMYLPHTLHSGNPFAKRSSCRFTTWPGNSAAILGRSHTQRQQMSCSRICSSSERCAAFWAQSIAKFKGNEIWRNKIKQCPGLGLWCRIFGHLSCKVLQHIVFDNQSKWQNSSNDNGFEDSIKTLSNHSPQWHDWHKGCRSPCRGENLFEQGPVLELHIFSTACRSRHPMVTLKNVQSNTLVKSNSRDPYNFQHHPHHPANPCSRLRIHGDTCRSGNGRSHEMHQGHGASEVSTTTQIQQLPIWKAGEKMALNSC